MLHTSPGVRNWIQLQLQEHLWLGGDLLLSILYICVFWPSSSFYSGCSYPLFMEEFTQLSEFYLKTPLWKHGSDLGAYHGS